MNFVFFYFILDSNHRIKRKFEAKRREYLNSFSTSFFFFNVFCVSSPRPQPQPSGLVSYPLLFFFSFPLRHDSRRFLFFCKVNKKRREKKVENFRGSFGFSMCDSAWAFIETFSLRHGCLNPTRNATLWEQIIVQGSFRPPLPPLPNCIYKIIFKKININ